MDYPLTKVLIDHFVAGLRDHRARSEAIEKRLATAIASMDADAQRNLSVAKIFAGDIDGVKLSRELKKMVGNPAFKPEPAISQLRRAEAAYIEAHDAHLADPANGSRIEEMRWAFGRLEIARAFYAFCVASLPVKRRQELERPKIEKSTATRVFRLASFSDEEQAALMLAPTDRAASIQAIDRIIVEGRASGKELRLIHATLVNPDSRDQFNQWLASETATISELDSATATADIPSIDADAEASPSPVAEPTHAFNLPPTQSPFETIDGAMANALATLQEWLSRSPGLIAKFRRVEGLWMFDDTFRVPKYAAAYALVAKHPELQQMIDRLKSGATS